MINNNKKYNPDWSKNSYFQFEHNSRIFSYYNELDIEFFSALYNELQQKLREACVKHNLKCFYFNCSPKKNLKLFLKINYDIDFLKTNIVDLKAIKFYQKNDFFWLHMNNLYKILFIFPILNNDNIYSYNFVIFGDQTFDLNKVFKHNWNLVNIDGINEININDIDYWMLERWFTSGTRFDDTIFDLKTSQKWCNIKLNKQEYEKKALESGEIKSIDDYNYVFYQNANTKYIQENFDEYNYSIRCFELLCNHIYSIDAVYYKILNECGYSLTAKGIYGLNDPFFTNYYELLGVVLYDKDKNKEKISIPEPICCCISESTFENGIHIHSFSEEYILNGFIDFDKCEKTTDPEFWGTWYIDWSNLKIK